MVTMTLSTMLRPGPDDRSGAVVTADSPAPAGHDSRDNQLGPSSRSQPLGPAGLVVILAGFALSLVDFFIVNVALATMARDLHASDSSLELVVSGYGITYALGLVMGGRLGDAFGRRRVFTYGLVGFTLTSALCGFAPSITFLIVARLLQGATAAMLVPQVLATIQAATVGPARARAISFYGATAGLGMVAGQVIGGVLLSLDIAGSGWRAVFLVNVPIGVAALLLVKRMPATKADRPPTIDRLGTVLFGVAMVSILVVVSEGRALGWPGWLWSGLVIAAAAGAWLVRVERRLEAAGRTPLLPPVVLAHASMRRGLAAAVPFFTGFGGFMFVYTLVAQDRLGLGPLAAGGLLTPMAVAFFIGSLAMPRVAARLGRKIITLGAAIQCTGLLLLALTLVTTWPRVPLGWAIVVLFYTGLGQGLAGPTLFRVVLADVPSSAAGLGSGVMVTSQQTALAIGATAGATLYLSLASSSGPACAAATVLGLQAAFAVIMFAVSFVMPDPA